MLVDSQFLISQGLCNIMCALPLRLEQCLLVHCAEQSCLLKSEFVTAIVHVRRYSPGAQLHKIMHSCIQ